MSLKAKVEAVIYAAEEPISIDQISLLVRDLVLAEEAEQVRAAAEAAANDETISETEESVREAASVESSETEAVPTEEISVVEDFEPVASAVEEAAETVPSPEAPAAISAEEVTAEDSKVSAQEAVEACEQRECSEAETEVTGASEQAEKTETETPANEETAEAHPAESASIEAPDDSAKKTAPKKEASENARVRARIRQVIEELINDYANVDRGMEIRAVAGGYRMSTKPEHHDVVRAFAKSLKPPVKLSLAALETLAVIAYKQPVTVPEISEIRGVEAGGVIGTLLDRKLITTAGRKQVVGRPILYKTSKEFLLKFGLSDVNELPSMEEFEKLAADQAELFTAENESAPSGEATATETPLEPEQTEPAADTETQPESVAEQVTEIPATEHGPTQEATEQTEPAEVEQTQGSNE